MKKLLKQLQIIVFFPFIYIFIVIFYRKHIKEAKKELIKRDIKPGNYPKMAIPAIVTIFYIDRENVSLSAAFTKSIGEFAAHTPVINTNKIRRNEPCPCGSGKKYKNCCQNKNN